MTSNLDQTAAAAVVEYHRRKALIFFEAAFGSLLDTYSLAEAKQIIQSYSDHMEEFWGEMPNQNENSSWNHWFEANKEKLIQLMNTDPEQAFFEAWLAGLEYGSKSTV